MVPRSEDLVECAEQNFDQVGSVEVVEVLFPEVPFVACLNPSYNKIAIIFL